VGPESRRFAPRQVFEGREGRWQGLVSFGSRFLASRLPSYAGFRRNIKSSNEYQNQEKYCQIASKVVIPMKISYKRNNYVGRKIGAEYQGHLWGAANFVTREADDIVVSSATDDCLKIEEERF
jgi:hypothetical protein